MEADDSYNITVTPNTTLLEPEPIQSPSLYQRIGRRLAALVFMLAMLFLGGIYQFGLLQATPDDTVVKEYKPVISAPSKQIPTTIFVLAESGEAKQKSASRLAQKANMLLAQAAVELHPVTVKFISVSDTDIPPGQVAGSPDELKGLLPPLDDDQLHVAFTSGLTGVNGVAFPGQQVVAVAEYTDSFDFRVLAHEVGHILKLDHVNDKSNLMFSGSYGTILQPDQARQANRAANKFLD